jgi:hypothetical protein
MRLQSRFVFLALVAGGIAIAGCSHANYAPLTLPSGTATATASASPGSSASPSASASASAAASTTPSASATVVPATCGTPVANSVYIAVGSYIEDESPVDATYGTLYGYAIVDSAGDYPLQSAPISLRPADTIQFVNVDPAAASGTDGTSHSAAGLESTSFPATYTFPSAAFSPVGSMLSDTADWSTGEIPAVATVLCYSQPITVPASGTYYFGDLDFYNLNSMRGVIVVSTNAPQFRKSVPPHRRR